MEIFLDWVSLMNNLMLLNWKISSELQIKDMCFLSNQLLSLTFNITEKPKLL